MASAVGRPRRIVNMRLHTDPTAVTNSSKFVATAFRDDAAKAPAGKTTFVRVYATETIGEGREI